MIWKCRPSRRPTRITGVPPVFLLTILLCVAAGDSFADSTKEAFEATAGQLKFLAANDVLYDRPLERFTPEEDRQTHNQLVAALLARNDPTDALLPLLKHENSKVRTLAILALFAKEDPKLLPYFVPLCDDDALTFRHPGLVANIAELGQATSPQEEQTVAMLPRQILRRYLEPAGYSGRPRDFDAYWSARKDRPFCATWFKIQLDRATQGARPVPQDRAVNVKALRDRIDALSTNDRAWTALYLSIPDFALYDEKACLAAAKSVGPDALLAMLRGKYPGDDPDLHYFKGRADDPLLQVKLWTLRHATQLLRPGDSAALLQIQDTAFDQAIQANAPPGHFLPPPTAWFAIAAADLDRPRAVAILADAFSRFPRQGYTDAWARADLATALWRHGGLAQRDVLRNWFYGETLKDEGVPHSRARFLQSLDPRDPNAKTLLTSFIADDRFASLDWSSLKLVIPMVNTWARRPVISDEEVASLQHPYGEQHVVQRPAEAMKTYPGQTKALNQTLAQWRQRLKDALPQITNDQ